MVLGENHINHLSKLELYILQDRKRRLVVREYIFTNSAAITRIGNCIIHSFAPWNTTWHCFYPSNPKVRAKMADIVNKVYCAIKKKNS